MHFSSFKENRENTNFFKRCLCTNAFLHIFPETRKMQMFMQQNYADYAKVAVLYFPIRAARTRCFLCQHRHQCLTAPTPPGTGVATRPSIRGAVIHPRISRFPSLITHVDHHQSAPSSSQHLRPTGGGHHQSAHQRVAAVTSRSTVWYDQMVIVALALSARDRTVTCCGPRWSPAFLEGKCQGRSTSITLRRCRA